MPEGEEPVRDPFDVNQNGVVSAVDALVALSRVLQYVGAWYLRQLYCAGSGGRNLVPRSCHFAGIRLGQSDQKFPRLLRRPGHRTCFGEL